MRFLQPLRGTPRTALAIVTLATFTDMLLYGLVVPVLPGVADEMGVSEWAIGVLFGSYSVTLLMFTPYFGTLSDRIGRRSPMIYGLIGLAAATALFALADNFWMLLAARLLQGVAAAATWTAALALVADVFPGESRGAAMGTALAGMTAGMLVGPPLGGLLYEWGGYRAPFIVAGAVVLVEAAALLLVLREPDRLTEEPVPLTRLLRDPAVQVAGGATLIAAAAWGLLEPTLPLYFEEEYEFSAGAVGLLFGAATLVYGVAAPAIGAVSDRAGGRRTMAAGVLVTAVALPLIGVPNAVAVAVAGVMVVSIGYGLLVTPTLPELAAAVDRRGGGGYAAAYAVFNAAYAGGMVAGPVLGGVLADALGFLPALIVVGVALLAYLPALRLGRGEANPSPGPPSPSLRAPRGEGSLE